MARTGGQDRPRGQNRAGYVKLAATTSSGGFPGTSGKEPTGQCKRHEMQVLSLRQESPLEKGMATYSSILAWSGGSHGEGHGNPLQYYCLEIPMDRGAWRATVQGVMKSQTPLKQLSTQAQLLESAQDAGVNRVIHPQPCINYRLALSQSIAND